MTLKVWVTHFSLMDGVAEESGPGLGVFTGERAPDKAALYLVADTFPPGQVDPCRMAVTTVSERFRSWGLSVTGGLGQAIRAAFLQLQQENRKRLPRHRVGIGLSCLALKGDQVYLAQAGPSLAYFFQAESSQRLSTIEGEASPETDQQQRAAPLGDEGEPEIRFHHLHFEEGNGLLLASPSLLRLLSPAEASQLGRLDPLQAMQTLYRQARKETHFSALYLSATPPPARSEAAPLVAEDRAQTPSEPTSPPPTQDMADTRPTETTQARQAPPRAEVAFPPPRRKRRPSLPPRLRLPLLLIGLGLILGLLALAVLLLAANLTQGANDAFTATLEQAEATRNTALTSTDPDLARAKFREAEQLVAKALSLRKDSRRALALKEEIEGALRRLDAIVPLPEPSLILDLRRAGGAQDEITQIVLGDSAYLLDSASRRVYRLNLDEGQIEPILTPEDSPPAMGNPARLLWMPPGGPRSEDALLLLDEERHLWEYDPKQDWHSLVLRGAAEWQSFQGVAGYAGNLYILDTTAEQVWRYVATDNGYDGNRQGVLGAARVDSARSMAIDGAIYLLDAKGSVVKFLSAQALPFPQKGLDRPVGSGGRLFTSPLNHWVYLSDPSNERLVVFDKEGRFRRQLVHPLLGKVGDFAVDESRGEVYLAQGGQLYRAPLPAEGELR